MKRKMTKAMLILDKMPDSCRDCPFHKKDCMLTKNRYIYEQLYICQVMPDSVYYGTDEDWDGYANEDDYDEPDIYINEHMINETKPEWCPLVEVKEEVEK